MTYSILPSNISTPLVIHDQPENPQQDQSRLTKDALNPWLQNLPGQWNWRGSKGEGSWREVVSEEVLQSPVIGPYKPSCNLDLAKEMFHEVEGIKTCGSFDDLYKMTAEKFPIQPGWILKHNIDLQNRSGSLKNIREKINSSPIAHQITGDLHLGAYNTAIASDNPFKVIINVSDLNFHESPLESIGRPTAFHQQDSRTIINAGVQEIDVRVLDSVSDLIHQVSGNGPILVHCWEGKNRSAECVCAYLHKYHGMTMRHAVDLVQSKRPFADPNITRLRHYKRFIRPTSERGLLACFRP